MWPTSARFAITASPSNTAGLPVVISGSTINVNGYSITLTNNLSANSLEIVADVSNAHVSWGLAAGANVVSNLLPGNYNVKATVNTGNDIFYQFNIATDGTLTTSSNNDGLTADIANSAITFSGNAINFNNQTGGYCTAKFDTTDSLVNTSIAPSQNYASSLLPGNYYVICAGSDHINFTVDHAGKIQSINPTSANGDYYSGEGTGTLNITLTVSVSNPVCGNSIGDNPNEAVGNRRRCCYYR